jgi:signal transduction histidine kinase
LKTAVAEMMEALSVQKSSGELMTFLIQDFMDLDQIKDGKFMRHVKPLNLRELVNQVIGLQKKQATN